MAFLHIAIDDKKIRNAIARAPELCVDGLNLALRETVVASQRFYRENMPTGMTGYLRRSTTYSFMSRVTAKVEPTAHYADYVEYGTRPHWTSVHNIEAWARFRGINPYVLQHSIATHGTKAHPYQEKTFEQTKEFATRTYTKYMNMFVRRFNQ